MKPGRPHNMDGPELRIGEQNRFSLNKTHESSRINSSELKEWFTRNTFRGLSLKYVLEWTVTYKSENQFFDVPAGSFFSTTKRDAAKSYFQSSALTRRICIDINAAIIAEAATVMAAKDDFEFDNFLASVFNHRVVGEKVYSVKENSLGEKLTEISRLIQSGQVDRVNKEWLLELAGFIILQEKGNYMAYHGLRSVKPATRKETLGRLYKAKAYMDEQFMENLDVPRVAAYCNMSEFRFFRSFKQAFGITPYKYLLQKRLEHSKKLLVKKIPAKNIAALCGFADLHSYSKAFKRIFGISPTGYQNK